MPPRVRRAIVPTVLMLLLLGACTDESGSRSRQEAEEPGPPPAAARPPAPLRSSVSMTAAGARAYAAAAPEQDARPRYDVTAQVDPETGEVVGTLTAVLPASDVDTVRFRFFAGLPDLDAEPETGDVTVDGSPAETTRDASVLNVDLPPGHGDSVTVVVPFGYTLPERDGGLPGLGALSPSDIGLLSRGSDSVNLGHWFPLWVPEGRPADPVPDGFGDIGNFAAADVSVALEVPDGWQVVDSGVANGETSAGDETVVRSEGAGMRDFSVVLLRDHESRTRELDGALAGVTLRATAPAAQTEVLDDVLDETEAAMRALSARFGAYPWREFDVVSTGLGASVAGMEWPGATWIEAGVFGGGVPGLGGLDLDDLEGSGGPLGELLEGAALTLQTARPWTITHEVAHSWWTVVVGNDSTTDPAVDEPLAQYTSCLVLRQVRRDGDAVCRAHIRSGYEQMRLVGEEDAVAAQPSDAFDSAAQYGGVVYGKAAAFYLELEEEFGVAPVAAALRTMVDRARFGTVTTDDVRRVLTARLGERADRLWLRWMEGTHGDQDLGVPERPGGENPLREQLEDLLSQLDGS